jgi:hypothetical protein
MTKNIKQTTARGRKMVKQRQTWLKEFWPEVNEKDLWNRNRCDGYTTMPRTMPHILEIIDSLTKGKPASRAYLALWCRASDEMVIRIQHEVYLASESGYSSERRVSTWQSRMNSLVEHGFIKVASGQAGPFEFVLIMNPYKVIRMLHKKEAIPKGLYNALTVRAMEVGAKDLDTNDEEDTAGVE